MFTNISLCLSVTIFLSSLAAQDTVRPRTTGESAPGSATDTVKPAPSTTLQPQTESKPAVVTSQTPGSAALLEAFNQLLNGIRKADVIRVTNVYWNSPRLILFNNNGTVTKGWEQTKKNRESSYPDITDVKLDVRDVSVIMLGRDGAVITCLWTQSQKYKGIPENATGRMTLVFRRTGREWKAVHLHTSPDKEDPSRVLPSEQRPEASPSPTPS